VTLDDFFDALWSNYVAMSPQAERIRQAFEERGEVVRNDHVAFRTLALDPIRLTDLEPHLLELGYSRHENYEFPEKKLDAVGYLPPQPDQPRIFLSELKVEELTPSAQEILQHCARQIDPSRIRTPDVLWAGRLWAPLPWQSYQLLQAESEYAAWVAALGLRPNHFTISVTDFVRDTTIEEVLQVVEGLGYEVNDSGGRVKGSPQVLLEQGSTRADRMPVPFADGIERLVPTCYYEFAKRYTDREGKHFQGFVASSADRIFESTDAASGR
jgi:Domain of unknown function (DUF1338)